MHRPLQAARQDIIFMALVLLNYHFSKIISFLISPHPRLFFIKISLEVEKVSYGKSHSRNQR